MTLCGVIFGVGFFIITQAQTSGFERFFIQTILGTNGAIRITDRFQDTMLSMEALSQSGSTFRIKTEGIEREKGITYPDTVIPIVKQYPEVIGVSEILDRRTDVSSRSNEETGRIFGIRLADHLTVSNLGDQITLGSIQDFEADSSTVILGGKLAFRLNVTVGDFINVDGKNETRRYRVAGIFESGVDIIDRERVYMQLSESRSLMEIPFGETILQVAIRSPEKAPDLAIQMSNELQHIVQSWQEREKVWLDVFMALRYSAALTVSTIILLAGIGMFNTLAMMVIEKTREIAILRSMGYTQQDITQIFVFQGIIIMIAGILLGWAFGALATFGVSKIPLRIRGIFRTDSFVVNWDWNHYLAAGAVAVIVVFIASLIPARRAAEVEPATIIRGSS